MLGRAVREGLPAEATLALTKAVSSRERMLPSLDRAELLGAEGQPCILLKNTVGYADVELRNVVSNQGKGFCFNLSEVASHWIQTWHEISYVVSPAVFVGQNAVEGKRGNGKLNERLLHLTRGEIRGNWAGGLHWVWWQTLFTTELHIEGGTHRISSSLSIIFLVPGKLRPHFQIQFGQNSSCHTSPRLHGEWVTCLAPVGLRVLHLL